jgi:hypothetical protein
VGLTSGTRCWRWLAVALVGLLAVVAVPTVAANEARAQENPTAPTGRAICNTAFTAVAVLGFGSFLVPPDAPLGPNDVVSALRPVLELCVSTFPPRPATRCEVTAGLVPTTPLPITPPDVGGILAEQAQALVDALGEPIAAALEGPLSSLFVSGLGCDLLAADVAPVPEVATTVTTAPTAAVAGGDPTGDEAAAPPLAGGDPTDGDGDDPGIDSGIGSVPIVRSLLPEPLRGAGTLAALAALVVLAGVLARQLTPRRAASLSRATARRR